MPPNAAGIEAGAADIVAMIADRRIVHRTRIGQHERQQIFPHDLAQQIGVALGRFIAARVQVAALRRAEPAGADQ